MVPVKAAIAAERVACPDLGGEAADKTAWPLLKGERNWGSWRLGVALATAAAATWCYLIGESVGYYLGFRQGACALFGGSMIGMMIVTFATLPICIRFGVDSLASTKPSFGSRGWVVPAVMQQLSVVGWNSVLLIFFAKSATQLLIAMHALPPGGSALVVPGTVLLACLLVFVFLQKGAHGLDRIARVLVAHVLVGVWMLYILVTHRWAELVGAVPVSASPDRVWNYTTGIEIGIISLLSWWPYIGAMVRMAPDGRRAAIPVMIGMGMPVPLLSLIGIAGVLVLKVSDPAEWLRTVGGTAYGIVALLFVAAANLGTASAGVYAAAIGLRHVPLLERVPWPALLLITIAPVAAVGLFIPELFFAHFGALLGFVGMAFAPLCGIQITDYYLLRRRRIDIRALYTAGPQATYRFVGGFNPASLIAMAGGCAVYCALLDPVSYKSHWPYDITTASLPALVSAGLLHALATCLIVKPMGKGGYIP